jgi:hypothetical protein
MTLLSLQFVYFATQQLYNQYHPHTQRGLANLEPAPPFWTRGLTIERNSCYTKVFRYT